MTRHISYFALLSLLFFTAALPDQEMKGRGPLPAERMARMLDLSEEQLAKIADLKLTLQKELIPLRNRMRTLDEELKLEMVAEQFDEKKLDKKLDEIAEVRKEIQKKHLVHQQAVRNLLTDEQRTKFDLHLLSTGFRGEGREGPGHFRQQRFRSPRQ